MTQPPQTEKQTGKRIVSKGKYVRKQIERGSNVLHGACLYIAAVVCGFLAMTWIYALWQIEMLDRMFGCVMVVAFSAGAWLLRKSALTILKQAREREAVVPLTRANTADLPAPDSLVRASAEPVQEQQSVLLRAAIETQERHEEQLVRASVGGTE